MLGKCNKADCEKHHPKALAAKIRKTAEQCIAQGNNLFKTAPPPADVNSSAGDQQPTAAAKTSAKVKAKAKR